MALVSRCARAGLFHGVSSTGLLQSNLMTFRVGVCIVHTSARRHLLSEDVLKFEEFQRMKLNMARSCGSKGQYFEMVNQKLKKNELILRNDLKQLLYLCQSPHDMITARDAVYRYHKENPQSEEYRFGPIFMRLCYDLGLEEMAAATLTDRNMRGFFNNSTSFNIAMDILFKKGCYESALEVLMEMKKQRVAFNRNTYMLGCGICYKINTPESYKISCALIEGGRTKADTLAYYFAVALALRQNDVETAQSLYSSWIPVGKDRIGQNLKVLILSMSGRTGAVDEVLSVLYSALGSKTPSFVKKLEFSQEVMDFVRLQNETGPYAETVRQMVTRLQEAGQVTPLSLDEMLCRTPSTRKTRLVGMFHGAQACRISHTTQSTLLSE